MCGKARLIKVQQPEPPFFASWREHSKKHRRSLLDRCSEMPRPARAGAGGEARRRRAPPQRGKRPGARQRENARTESWRALPGIRETCLSG